jgi:hypothetical protein
VKPISQYAKLDNFITDIENTGNHLPFKIMGKRKFPDPKKGITGTYYTASMLAEVYRNIGDPDQIPNFQSTAAPFGEILKLGCRLYGGTKTYSAQMTRNHKSGANIFQGDLVALDLSADHGPAFFKHRLSMVTSHSCAIANSQFVSLIPVYLESELDQIAVTHLRGQLPTNIGAVRGGWMGNENVNFLGLPAEHIKALNEQGDRMLACLHLQTVVPKSIIPLKPMLRLTYRALSYFQLRLSLLYMRDVQDSDDTREF